MALFDFLEKEHTIAGPGFNRWLVPPAALAIHLCIGMAYGFSVFWLPLSRAIGIKDPDALKTLRRLPPSSSRAKQIASKKSKQLARKNAEAAAASDQLAAA